MYDLAMQLLAAADIRENSWDGKEYHTTIWGSAHRAAGALGLYGEARSELVSLLLAAAWNEALEWARRVNRPVPRKA